MKDVIESLPENENSPCISALIVFRFAVCNLSKLLVNSNMKEIKL